MNYLQKKKQAIIMMLAAQIIKTVQGYPVTVNDCESGTAVDYTVWGNTVADGDTVMYVGDKTNNLIPYPYYESTKTVNGITFTDNGNGTITANGTATADSRLLIKYGTSLLTVDTSKSYVLSGCPAGGSTSTYLLLAFDNKSGYGDLGKGAVFTPKTNKLELSIRIYSGATVKNLTFKPQLEIGETATEYEPHRAPSTANIYLDEPLKKSESINFGADNLPGLQLFEGSNVITAGTEVKPEKISVDYYEKG